MISIMFRLLVPSSSVVIAIKRTTVAVIMISLSSLSFFGDNAQTMIIASSMQAVLPRQELKCVYALSREVECRCRVQDVRNF